MTTTSLTPLHVLDAQSLSIERVVPISAHPWPGRLSTDVSLGGAGGVRWDDLTAGLLERRGLVDAVVFTGAEPTAQLALADAMAQVRELDYLAGLRTKGSRPHRLAEVLSVADWVSLEVGGSDFVAALTSLELVMRSGVEYEVTLTVDPALHSREDILATARAVIRRGAHAPVLQGRRIYQVIRLDDLPDLERR